MPKTVYQLLVEKEIDFSRRDLRSIANWINSRWLKKHEENPGKIVQQEGERTFEVFAYPDEWISDMERVVTWFFKNKKKRAEEHVKRIEEDQNKKSSGKDGAPKPKTAGFESRKTRKPRAEERPREKSNYARPAARRSESDVVDIPRNNSQKEPESTGNSDKPKKKRKRIAKTVFTIEHPK